MRHREEKVTRTHKELYSWHLVNDEACPHLKDYHHFLKGPLPWLTVVSSVTLLENNCIISRETALKLLSVVCFLRELLCRLCLIEIKFIT